MEKGLVISVVAGYYHVESKGQIYLCRGRGRLRKQGVSPLAGDWVEFLPAPDGTGVLEKVLPRKNRLHRPAVANVDGVVVVLAPHSPPPDLLLVDKLLAMAGVLGLGVLVCVNKADLAGQEAARIASMYRASAIPVLVCSALTGQGLSELDQALAGKVWVLAGQSGVGKSHLTTRLAPRRPQLPVQVGELSAKAGRGRHTTRQVTLLTTQGGSKIADTPGFSVLDLDLSPATLPTLYPEFVALADRCKFSSCRHIHEPGCAVKEQLAAGKIVPSRYENYVLIYNQVKEKEDTRY